RDRPDRLLRPAPRRVRPADEAGPVGQAFQPDERSLCQAGRADLRGKRVMLFKSWKDDLLAPGVGFLVAPPPCMGIAIASGLPPAAGILTGVLGGLVVGLLAGCPLQVSGPAAGLSVLVWEIVQEHRAPALGVIVLLAGGLQLAAGLFRLGQWFRA